MSKYLVTGGAGFIGSNIVETLVHRGEYVRVLDNFSTGKPQNLAALNGKIEFIKGDIRDLERVREAVKGMDYVFHQAALPSVTRSIKDPITTNDVNISGTLNVLVAARDAKVKRVIYAASSSAYGDTPTLPKREDMPANPISPYGVSKYVGEQYCQLFTALYGLETVCLRYFNVFGPRQNPHSPYSGVISIFIKDFLSGVPPKIYGDGEQSRDFTFVSNAVNANLLACHAEGASGQVFNIACGDRTTINELAWLIRELLGSDIEPVHLDQRPGDIRHSLADISKAQTILGYEPKVDLTVGLMKTIDWFRSEQIFGKEISPQPLPHARKL
ncbi:MAG: SDR family oxidoreductase [Candidatus Poribacteria bacterium]